MAALSGGSPQACTQETAAHDRMRILRSMVALAVNVSIVGRE